MLSAHFRVNLRSSDHQFPNWDTSHGAPIKAFFLLHHFIHRTTSPYHNTHPFLQHLRQSTNSANRSRSNHLHQISFEELLQYDNGQTALDRFESEPTPISTPEPVPTKSKRRSARMSSTRPRSTRQLAGFVNTADAIRLSDDEAASEEDSGFEDSRGPRGRKRKSAVQSQYYDRPEESDDDEEQSEEEETSRRGPRLRFRNGQANARNLRGSAHSVYTNEIQDEDGSSDDLPFLDSDLPGAKRRRTKLRIRGTGRSARDSEDISLFEIRAIRASGRSTRHQGGMAEVGEDNIYLNEADIPAVVPAKPKTVGAREVYKSLPRNDEFRMRHVQDCETCGQGANFGVLIHCQGCTLTYHKGCIGTRATREHLVTKVHIPREGVSKVGEDGALEQETESFSVLQCKRCVAYPRRKDPTAPDQGKCADCKEHGNACLLFRPRKSTGQEQKEREENGGEDPSYDIDPSRINQADNVLFRCLSCFRAFHFEHLPSRNDLMDMDGEVDTEQRWREYSRDWKCKDCASMPAKVSGIVAWKPVDEETYDPALPLTAIDEDEKAYLVRWEGMSYFRAFWMPGAWVWGVTAPMMRHSFAKREDAQHPKLRTEDAIPEDYLRTDIVLDIRFTSIVDIRTEEIDQARIREVEKALIKYKGLGYEDAVWEAPPSSDDAERWPDFVTAYNDWVLGRYVKPQRPSLLKAKLEKVRTQDFAKLEKHEQPDNVEGGTLMKYQIEGLNWLYYKWFTQKNCVLADEMGLGKTIQIIAFLATLVKEHFCFPFLVVVPNSTCPNWRREIKRWAPTLRVVAYYGSRQSRDLAYKHELFPNNSKELRCHIVVTSYDAASDDSSRRFFRSVSWQALIVDEGQRLKNDKNLLYSALGQLKAPFRILLTGTPLQNNQRELFNLLHFLDDTYDAAQLEKDYEELDANKIGELHDMIRPFFLRRTKAQVLTFLPPMAQIIVPVSMTIVQKKVYRTILAKNPELMKAIFSSEATLKQAERASLSNILMQLRKCLCHPFVYNKSIEERNVTHTTSHRNLVDASAKLRLLELLLPKLQERGHRVLIFSQFLDMLDIVEDFLDGMQLRYQRLDGSINALQKQKRIDEFNAPDSPLFAFILSTRAGGVGINLASADTVIILDPDFNPHQDIQALSRAHRIGQSKKVLCFQLVTRASAEERIMQMGRKKLALDHVLIQEMDADDADQNDLVSVLRHGANELFEDEGDQDIIYDGSSVERLLDRSHMEDTKAGEDKSAETQFSFARVWANSQGALQDEIVEEVPEEQAPDPNVWANILRERERLAAEEATAKADAYGRGRRARGQIDYGNEPPEGVEGLEITPMKKRGNKNGDASDTDFQDDASSDDEEAEDGEALEMDDVTIASEGAKLETGRKKEGKSKPSPKNPVPTSLSTPRKPILVTKARGGISLVGRQPRASKPKTMAKPKPPPKTSSELVEKSNDASGEHVKNEKSAAAPETSESNMKKKGAAQGKKQLYPGEGQFKADGPRQDQTSTLPMKKSDLSAIVTVAQPDTRGLADDPIVLSDDDDDATLS